MVTIAAPLDVSVIVPVYNEERRLRESLRSLTSFLRRQDWDWELRIVDDGSTDSSVKIAEEAAAGERRVVVQREPHRGKGGAVRAGMLAAKGEFRIMCDADLAAPAQELPKLLAPMMAGCDVAIATREGAQAVRIGEPWVRHAAGRVFNLAVRSIVLPGIQDSQCGLKVFSARAAAELCPRTVCDGWAFDVEMLARARMLGLRVVEVPIEWRYRAETKIKMVSDGAGMLMELWRIRRRVRRGP